MRSALPGPGRDRSEQAVAAGVPLVNVEYCACELPVLSASASQFGLPPARVAIRVNPTSNHGLRACA